MRWKKTMVKSDLYKRVRQLLIMGAPEAVTFLDALYRHRILSRRTFAQYVIPTLLQGSITMEGTAGYREMEEAVYQEVFDAMLGRKLPAADDPDEEAVSNYSYFLLRDILQTASDGRHRLSLNDPEFNGFPEEAYREVRGLIDNTTTWYLGLVERYDRLEMKDSMIGAILQEDCGYPGDIQDSGFPGDFDPEFDAFSHGPDHGMDESLEHHYRRMTLSHV